MTKTSIENDTNQVVTCIRDGDKVGIMMFLRQGGDPNTRNHMGWTLLHLACLEGQAEIAEILLEAGAMVNCCTTDMCTPLHLACARGNMKAVEVLISKGAYINAQDKAGNTPLHEAAKAFHPKVVKYLLQQKADRKKVNKKNQTFIELVGQQLMPTVECGDVEVLVDWLDWGLNANTVGNLHWSLLHHSSAMGQINIASLLLERGADVNVLDSNRCTPLHSACFHGNKRIAELLLGRGADINAKDQRGNTPLHSAIAGEYPEVINLLLESGCDTTIPNKEGQIFTHLVNEFLIDAIEKSRVAQVISLLKGKANPDTKDASGYPVLCSSSFKGDMLIVDALLEAGANPNICSDVTQKTPLHYASNRGNIFVMKALLDKGASVSIKDKNGFTALHEAAKEADKDTVTMLVGRGSSLNAQDVDGNTPLHVAARWGQSDIVEILLEKGTSEDIKNNSGMIYSDLALMRAVRTEDADQVMSGLAWGGNPNIQDSKGWTLLHHAVYKSAHDVCFVLLESEADVNIPDKHGRTPLLLAAYRGEHQIVEMLTKAGADINAKDSDNQTPLHWAADEGSIETVELLLSKGANRNIKNRKGLLYCDLLLKHLYFAVRHNDENKVESLLRAGADQSAELEGTDITPREEAKRRKYYSILKKMVSLAPPKPPPKPNREGIMALEDVRKLFEDCEDDESSGESSDESDKEVYDPDEDAYWRMHNAPIVLNAKDILEEEEKSFWGHWEEKPKVITAKEFFKEEVPWWETVSSSDEESSGEENSGKVISTIEQMKRAWGVIVPAKEFFREDECWWRDAVEDLDKPKRISAKEYFKEKTGWWEDSSEEEKEEIERKDKDIRPKNKNIIAAKEFFKEDDVPWWTENSSDEDSDNDKKCLHIEGKIYKNEEKSEEESLYEDIEESITEDWDTANDSIMSDTSTMYSASEGDKIMAADLFMEKPWWDNDDNDQTDNSLSEDEEISEDKSDRTETTEIADEGSYIDKGTFQGRTRILSSTESDASTNIILDAADSNSIENLLDLDIDEEPPQNSVELSDTGDVDNRVSTPIYSEPVSSEMEENANILNETINCHSLLDEKVDSIPTNIENTSDQSEIEEISEIGFANVSNKDRPEHISEHLGEPEEIYDTTVSGNVLRNDNVSYVTHESNDTITKEYSTQKLDFLESKESLSSKAHIDDSTCNIPLENDNKVKEIIDRISGNSFLKSLTMNKNINEKQEPEERMENCKSLNIREKDIRKGEIIPSEETEKENIIEEQLIHNLKFSQEPKKNMSSVTVDLHNESHINKDLEIKTDNDIVSYESNISNIANNLSLKLSSTNRNDDNDKLSVKAIACDKDIRTISSNDEIFRINVENWNSEEKDVKHNTNVQYLNSLKSVCTKFPNSSINARGEKEFSKFSLDKACHLELGEEVTANVPHSQVEKENSEPSLTLIPVSSSFTQNVVSKDMKETCTNSMDEKVVELKNAVINKMDACLARVDASLAWIDARMAKDSTNKSNNIKSKSLECIPTLPTSSKFSKLKVPSHENIKNHQEGKNNQENFQIFRIKIRITDELTSNTLENYFERPNSTSEVILKNSSSENALYNTNENSTGFIIDQRNKLQKCNSLAKLETINRPKIEASNLTINISEDDSSGITNKKECSLLSSLTETRSSPIKYPLVVRRHSSGDVNLNLPNLDSKILQNTSNNSSDKNLRINDSQTNKGTFPLKIRRHSSSEMHLNNSKLGSNEKYDTKEERNARCLNSEKLSKNVAEASSPDKNLTNDIIQENKSITVCNKMLENLNNNLDSSNSKANISLPEIQKHKPIQSKININHKLNYDKVQLKLQQKTIPNEGDGDNCRNKDLTYSSPSNEPQIILKDIPSPVSIDSNISSSPDKSNWIWSTFQSKNLNEYDKLLSSISSDCRPHSPFKKCKSVDAIHDPLPHKEITSLLKHENCASNPNKNRDNESLNIRLPTNKCVTESNLRIKPPLPPRRTKDNRQSTLLNDNFDNTKSPLKKVHLNDKCLSCNPGEKQKSDLEDHVASCMNTNDKTRSVDVKSNQVLDNYIPDQTPKVRYQDWLCLLLLFIGLINLIISYFMINIISKI